MDFNKQLFLNSVQACFVQVSMERDLKKPGDSQASRELEALLRFDHIVRQVVSSWDADVLDGFLQKLTLPARREFDTACRACGVKPAKKHTIQRLHRTEAARKLYLMHKKSLVDALLERREFDKVGIGEVEMPIRIWNTLRKHGFNSLQDVMERFEEIAGLRGMGRIGTSFLANLIGR